MKTYVREFATLSVLLVACSSASPGTSDGTAGGSNNGGAVGVSGAPSSSAGAGATPGSAGATMMAGGGAPAAAGSGNAPGTAGSVSTGGQPTGGGGMGAAGHSGGMGAAAGHGGGGGAGATGGAGGAGAAGGAGGGTGGSAAMSSGCGKMPTIASSQYNNGHHITITAGGLDREYILNVPTNYDNTHPYRFVIAYHELNGNDDEMYRNKYYHLLPLSNDSTIFVAPNGQQSGKNCTMASGCGWPNPNDSDMLLADAVVAQIEQNFCVDTNRIFATGWSYGGSMSYETACERPLGGTTNGVAGFIRAIAVYSGAQLSGSCKPTKPVAYYASHGTNDTVLNYSNGLTLLNNMVTVDGCTAMTPTKVTSGNHVCTNFMGCKAGYPVEFCSFNGPHTPDPTDPGQPSWEYQNVWTYLSQF